LKRQNNYIVLSFLASKEAAMQGTFCHASFIHLMRRPRI